MMGLGFAGLLRRFAVYPIESIWPTILPTLALNRALLQGKKEETVHGWKISMYNFFWIDLTAQFDTWLESALDPPDPGQERESFIRPLPQRWREGCTSAALQLRALQRALDTLPPPPDGGAHEATGLTRLLEASETLVRSSLAELELMRGVEGRVLEQEEQRVERRLRALFGDGDAERGEKLEWVPAWEVAG